MGNVMDLPPFRLSGFIQTYTSTTEIVYLYKIITEINTNNCMLLLLYVMRTQNQHLS
jgi:hypothetical protein